LETLDSAVGRFQGFGQLVGNVSRAGGQGGRCLFAAAAGQLRDQDCVGRDGLPQGGQVMGTHPVEDVDFVGSFGDGRLAVADAAAAIGAALVEIGRCGSASVVIIDPAWVVKECLRHERQVVHCKVRVGMSNIAQAGSIDVEVLT